MELAGYDYQLLNYYSTRDISIKWASVKNKQAYKDYCRNPPTTKSGQIIPFQPIFLINNQT